MFVKQLKCVKCSRHFEPKIGLLTCPHCGETGILEVEFDYEAILKHWSKQDLTQDSRQTIFRYLPLLPIEGKNIDKTLAVGNSPMYRSNKIEVELGLKQLYFKDDSINPTASLKDRASVIACVKALEEGYDTVSCSSTGNAASSLAGNAARLGLKSVIFVPKRAPQGKLAQLKAFGAELIQVDGDYKDTFQLSKLAIETYGWYNRNAAINPYLIEGKKTVSLEICEQLHFEMPDWVVVSVGDGCTVGGVYKGFKDFFELGFIKKIPKILGVQSTGCAPFVHASLEHRALLEEEENTIADSIAVGIPRNPDKAIWAIEKSHGAWIAVDDTAIISALKELGKKEGIFAEPAASASFAGLKEALKQGIISKQDSVVVIITGNGLKDTKNALAAFEPTRFVSPTLEDLQKYRQEMNGERQ